MVGSDSNRKPHREPGVHPRPRVTAEYGFPRLKEMRPQVSEWLPDALEELLPSFADAVHQVVDDHDEFVGRTRESYAIGRHLDDIGVDAFGGVYPDLITYYALRFHDREISEDNFPGTDQRRTYLAGLRDDIVGDLVGFCSKQGLYDGDLDSLESGPLRLLDVGNVTPRIALELDAEAWKDEDHRETRQASLDALAALARECHIDLILSPELYAHLDQRHPDWVDAHLSTAEYLTEGRTDSRHTVSLGQGHDVDDAWDALRDFEAGKGRVRLLANLPTEGAREERDLVRDEEVGLAASSVTAYAGDLEAAGLVEVDRRGKYNEVSLTLLGEAAQEFVTADYRLRPPTQTGLDELHLTHPPHADASTVCPADSAGSGERVDGDPPISSDEWIAATGDAPEAGYIQWLGDKDGPQHVRPWELHRREMSPDRVDGINIVDDPVMEFQDGRVSYLSCFEDEALVITEWGKALPTLVRLATTLFSPKAFNKILTPSAIGEKFEELFDGQFDNTLGTLQQRTQVGWLREKHLEYDRFRERFLSLRANLLQRLSQLKNSNDYEKREKLFEDAHGFLTSATHLYRAIGVNVTFSLRFPDTETLLRKDDIRENFRRFIQHTIPKHYAYGCHSAFRCIFESREDKVNFAMPPEVDPDDPNAAPTATWIFSGPAMSAAEDVIREGLEATAEENQLDDRSHDEIALDVPVAVANTYAGIRNVVEQFADRKEFDATRGSRDLRHLIRLLLAVTGQGSLRGSPRDVAEAMLHVARANEFGQHVRICDIEYGLSQLPASRLLPDLPPSTGKIAQTLLRADRPLGRSEILDRAGISESTYDRRKRELEAFDFIEQTEDRKWRIHLSPWFITEGDRRHPEFDIGAMGLQGVLWDVLERYGVELDDVILDALTADQVDVATLVDEVAYLRPWIDVLETLTAHFGACSELGLLGEEPLTIQLGEPPPGQDTRDVALKEWAPTEAERTG